MPSTYTSNLRIELQATGENRATWGNKANNVFQRFEDAITGYVSISMADADVTLTTANGATDEARMQCLSFTGNNSETRRVTIPTVPKTYVIRNATGGGNDIEITNGIFSVTLVNGGWYYVWTDGLNVFKSINQAVDYARLDQVTDLSAVTDGPVARENLGLGTPAAVYTNLGISGPYPIAALARTFEYTHAGLDNGVEAAYLEWTPYTFNVKTLDPSGSLTLTGDNFSVNRDGYVDWDVQFILASSSTTAVVTRIYDVISGPVVRGTALTGSGHALNGATSGLNYTTSSSKGWARVTAGRQYRIEYYAHRLSTLNGVFLWRIGNLELPAEFGDLTFSTLNFRT